MSLLLSAAGAAVVLACWAIGAYNRLIRLRAQALHAFGTLLVPLHRRHVLAESVAAAERSDPAAADAPTAPATPSALHAAAWQFGVTLAAAQARPLEAHAMRSLHAAEAVLRTVWQRHFEDGVQPAPPQIEWHALAAQQADALAGFDRAAAHYNDALRQFPASIIAALFRLREAASWQP